MADKPSFSISFADFDKRFTEYALMIAPAAADAGMWEALRALKADCDNVSPTTPLLEGNLRGDYTLILEGITQSKAEEKSGGKGGDHAKGGAVAKERYGAKDIVAQLIFRQPYAARWHEAIDAKVKWSEGGPHAKYAETKLSMFMKKYVGIVASRIKGTTGK